MNIFLVLSLLTISILTISISSYADHREDCENEHNSNIEYCEDNDFQCLSEVESSCMDFHGSWQYDICRKDGRVMCIESTKNCFEDASIVYYVCLENDDSNDDSNYNNNNSNNDYRTPVIDNPVEWMCLYIAEDSYKKEQKACAKLVDNCVNVGNNYLDCIEERRQCDFDAFGSYQSDIKKCHEK